MGARLYRVLLGRQSEGVVPQGVQHVPAVHPVVAREDVGGDVAQRMTDMQARTGGVREHVLDEQLVGRGRPRQRSHRIRCVEGAPRGPRLLPFGLQSGGQLGVVAVRRCIGIGKDRRAAFGHVAPAGRCAGGVGCTSVLHGPAFFSPSSPGERLWTTSPLRVEGAHVRTQKGVREALVARIWDRQNSAGLESIHGIAIGPCSNDSHRS